MANEFCRACIENGIADQTNPARVAKRCELGRRRCPKKEAQCCARYRSRDASGKVTMLMWLWRAVRYGGSRGNKEH